MSAAPVRADWRALGPGVTLLTTAPSALAPARAAVEHELAAIDLAASRFREDSDLSRVNRAGGRPVPVGSLFLEALEVALRALRLTGGAVDPTVGQALILAGYDRDFDALSPEAAAPSAPPDPLAPLRVKVIRAPGEQAIQVDEAAGRASVRAGVKLDFGATAKALAADRAAARAHLAGAGAGVLVSLGGDIATAGPPPPGGWAVRVVEDHDAPPEIAGQVVSIESGALATSSTTVRRWGAGAHHIIDPWQGRPVDVVWRTATVAAATCVDANIAATAAIVLGRGAERWLSASGVPARLVDRAGGVRLLGGWPQEARAA